MQISNPSITASLPILKMGRGTQNIAGGTTNFLLEASGNNVRLIASNLVSETTCEIEAKNEGDASVSIPPEFAEIIERCPDLPVTMKLTEKRAAVTIGATKSTLSILPGDSFPRLAAGKVMESVKTDSIALKKVLGETIAFAPTNDPRHYLNGVQLTVSKARLTSVATNGHIIAISAETVETALAKPVHRIIPVQAVKQLLKVLDGDKAVSIDFAENAVLFTCGKTQVSVKPIVGNFPSWTQLLKDQPAHTVQVPRTALIDALGRVGIFADAKVPVASFDLKADGMSVKASNKESGDTVDAVPYGEGSVGQPKTFNARIDYIVQAASTAKSDSIRLSYSEPDTSPLWIRKSETDDCIVIVSPYKM